MKKKIYHLLTVVVIGTFSITSCYFANSETPKIVPLNKQVETSTSRDSIPPNFKTYTNDKLGIKFQYSNTWLKNEKDVESINLSGDVTSIEINFTDTISNTSVLIAYHLAPKGAELYQYANSQCNSSKSSNTNECKQIIVAGNKGLEVLTTIKKDARGNLLNVPLKLIIIYFLDKQQTGEIELQFKTPLPDDKEVAKFRQMLSTFKFNK